MQSVYCSKCGRINEPNFYKGSLPEVRSRRYSVILAFYRMHLTLGVPCPALEQEGAEAAEAWLSSVFSGKVGRLTDLSIRGGYSRE